MIGETLLKASIQGGVIALVVWLFVRLFPTIKSDTKVWLWRLVYVKFVLSLLQLGPIPLPVMPNPAIAAAAKPMLWSPPHVAQAVPAGSAVETLQTISTMLSFNFILTVVWGLIVFLLVARYPVAIWRSRRLFRSASPVTEPAVLNTLSRLADRANLARTPRLYASEQAPAAMVVAGRPCSIVLPSSILTGDQKADLNLVLSHEIAHLVRKDLWWDTAASVIQTLFFFHPLLWIAAWEANLARESAADEWALQFSGASAHGYADMLFRATVQLPMRSRLVFSREPGVLGILESHRALERRLKAMKHFSTEPRLNRSILSLGMLVAVVALLPAYTLVQRDVKQAQTDTGKNVKQLELGLIMYTQDYDEVFPNTQSQKALKYVLWPYLKNGEAFKTYNPNGGFFQLAPNVAGINYKSMPKPADTVSLFETKTWPDGQRWVGFSDGHAKLLTGDAWKALEPSLKTKFKVVAGPLPGNYGADWSPEGRVTPPPTN